MALLVMILRKLVKNKWLEISLLLGLVFSVALMSSMPIYKNAILNKMLVKDLESVQTAHGQYPGTYMMRMGINALQKTAAQRKQLFSQTAHFMEQAVQSMQIPALYSVIERESMEYNVVPSDPQKVDASINRFANMGAIQGMDDHIKLIDGRMPSPTPVDGVYEALVTDQALSQLHMVLGDKFEIKSEYVEKSVNIIPVGVFEKKDDSSLFWYYSDLSKYIDTFLIDYSLFEQDFTYGDVLPVEKSTWYYALDYHQFNLKNVDAFLSADKRIQSYFQDNFFMNVRGIPAKNTIQTYLEKKDRLQILLWSLNIPVILMLGLYLYMISNLIIERQKAEIAVLRSRGASRLQIMVAYTVEGVILGLIALLIGPYLGVFFTNMLGASNGFLEFVHRTALHAEVNREAIKYALVAVVSSTVMTLIPSFIATRQSIVGQKQKSARSGGQSFWHKYFLDILLLGVSGYGLYQFYKRMSDLVVLELNSNELHIDPLLFIVPALFMVGAGLLVLRIYPLFIRFVYWIGRKWWPSFLYATLIQVGRSARQYQFLMLFLIITISIGIFSSSAARTLNNNAEDQIHYKNGADIVLTTQWMNNKPFPLDDEIGLLGDPSSSQSVASSSPKEKLQYTEPPFLPYTTLPEVASAARVYTNPDAYFKTNNHTGKTTLMGIDTDEFGTTTWFRRSLLDHYLNSYLNLIAPDPSAVLISKSMADQNDLKPGDEISLGWDSVDTQPFTVYGVVNYFPTFNPGTIGTKEQINQLMLVVANLDVIQTKLALEPYQVWLKLKPGASREKLYQAMADQNMPIVSLTDTIQEIAEYIKDPFQMAVNGVMTLGFLISVIISFFGFLLFWILSLYSRVSQLGVIRAMGVSFRKLVSMLVMEQMLTSGAAILIGVMIGKLASRLFVPLFQLAFDPSQQAIPFRVAFQSQDLNSLYVVVGVMLIFGLLVLAWQISVIKIHQAVKLGED